MDRHRQNFLRTLLSNHILIKNAFDLGGFRNIRRGRQVLIMVAFFSDDIVAKIDAFIADIDGWAGDEFAHLVLALPAKRADEISRPMFTVLCHRTPA